jgi:1,4-alpha-glucan branching enzyme
MSREGEVEMVSGSDAIAAAPAEGTISLPEGSWGEGGYHSVWLNQDNHWTWERLYPAQRRMRGLARLAGGPARDFVTQAARELLLAEASDWQFLISTWSARDYAELRFTDHIDRFERLAEAAERITAGGSASAQDQALLADCQAKDAAFPNLDPTVWARTEVVV